MKRIILTTFVAVISGMTLNHAQAQTDDLVFVGVQPCRIVDTRKSNTGFPLATGTPQSFLVTGTDAELFDQRGTVSGGENGCQNPRPGATPAAIAAYIIAVSGGDSSTKGVLFAYPSTTSGDIPAAGTGSTINFPQGQNLGNSTTILLCTPGDCPTEGQFSILSRNTPEHAVVDVLGYYYPVARNARLAYTWASNSTSASYTPGAFHSYNSSGGAITITRSSVGSYIVTFAGLEGGSAGGHVQVTKYGSGAGVCHVVAWILPQVEVRCYDMSGAPADSQYTVEFKS